VNHGQRPALHKRQYRPCRLGADGAIRAGRWPAVQLFFNVQASPALSDRIKANALKIAGKRASKEGVLMIEASRFRSQERNREDARERLKELILKAAEPPPPPRKKTKPTRGSVERRLKEKSGRGEIKKLRGRPGGD